MVHVRTDESWKSVLAEAELEHDTDSKLDTSVVDAINAMGIPYFQVHRQPAGGLEIEIIGLQIDKLSGIVEAQGSA